MNFFGRVIAESVRAANDSCESFVALGTLTGQSPADELQVARSGGFRRAIRQVQQLISRVATHTEDGVQCSPLHVGTLDGIEIVPPDAADDRVIVFFHGGAHCFGSPAVSKELVGRLSMACRARVIVVDYRLAPDHPFPAGLEDALATLRWTRERHPDAHVMLAGDSAGGNLAFALLVKLAQLGERQPAACIGLSPWLLLDLERIPSIRNRSSHGQHWGGTVINSIMKLMNTGNPMQAVGEVMNGKTHDVIAAQYFQDHPASDPLISPILAGEELVRKFPPVLLHADKDEPLSSDSRQMAELCKKAGVEVELEFYSGTMHVFQAFPLMYPKSSQDSLVKIGAFLNRVLSRKRKLLHLYTEVELHALSIKELKKILCSRGLCSDGIIEKSEIVQRILLNE